MSVRFKLHEWKYSIWLGALVFPTRTYKKIKCVHQDLIVCALRVSSH